MSSSTPTAIPCTGSDCVTFPEAKMNSSALWSGFGVALLLLLIATILISALQRSRSAAARRRARERAAAELPTPPPPSQPPPPFTHHAHAFPSQTTWPSTFHATPGARAFHPVFAVYRTQPGGGDGVAAALIAPWVARRPSPPFDPDDLAVFKVGREQMDTQCGICLDPFDEEDVSAGQCLHMFHSTCIKSWLAKDAARSCPVCRNSFMDTSRVDNIIGGNPGPVVTPPPPLPAVAPVSAPT